MRVSRKEVAQWVLEWDEVSWDEMNDVNARTCGECDHARCVRRLHWVVIGRVESAVVSLLNHIFPASPATPHVLAPAPAAADNTSKRAGLMQ